MQDGTDTKLRTWDAICFFQDGKAANVADTVRLYMPCDLGSGF